MQVFVRIIGRKSSDKVLIKADRLNSEEWRIIHQQIDWNFAALIERDLVL